jgi:hypothetical protein
MTFSLLLQLIPDATVTEQLQQDTPDSGGVKTRT